MLLVLLAYLLVRRILPRPLQLVTMVFSLAVCVSSLMWFNLFSFLTYVPALQTGAIGILLLLLGILTSLQTGSFGWTTWLAVGAGAFIAALSKLESVVAAYSTLGILALVDRGYWFSNKSTKEWIMHYGRLFVVCTVPALSDILPLCSCRSCGRASLCGCIWLGVVCWAASGPAQRW